MRWLYVVSLLLGIGHLRAQVDPVVEFWAGIRAPQGKQWTYRGTETITLGGNPWFQGTVTYHMGVFYDSTQPTYLWTFSRQDSTFFPGLNYQLPPRPALSPVQDPVFPAPLILVGFPFLDVFSSVNSYDFVVVPDTQLLTGGPQIFDLVPRLQASTPALPLMLDPAGAYPPGVWDTLYLDTTHTVIQLIDELQDTLVLPTGGCNGITTVIARRIRLHVQDTVYMGDGSRMWLQMDRTLWWVPGCMVVKDSVYRTLTPTLYHLQAQSQTVVSSIVLEGSTPVEEASPRLLPARALLRSSPRGWRIAAPEPIRRVRVRDALGRRVQVQRQGNVLVPPAPGLYMLEIESASGTRWILKGVFLR